MRKVSVRELLTQNDRLGIRSGGVSQVISSPPPTLIIPILRCNQTGTKLILRENKSSWKQPDKKKDSFIFNFLAFPANDDELGNFVITPISTQIIGRKFSEFEQIFYILHRIGVKVGIWIQIWIYLQT